jgi:DNA polymerase V
MWFGLVDCNNFYASCERVFNPSLNGRPVVVLSNNDGCVIARSNEAKEIGVEMGTPAFMVEDFLEKHNVAVFSSNYALYGDMSKRVMDTLATFTPEIEVYSIDESFLNLEGFEQISSLSEYAQLIRKTTTRNTGIPVSVGIAPTKTLAKLANKIAKGNKEHNGTYAIDTEEKRIVALKSLPIGKVWGIGGRYEKFLQSKGINTIFDFTQLSTEWVKDNMSIVGVRTQKELLGQPCIELELVAPKKKGICVARSFGEMQTEYSVIEEAVANFASSISLKLRKQGSCANNIHVFLHTNIHRKDLPQCYLNRTITLPVPSNSNYEIVEYALKGLKSLYKKGYYYKKAGVMVTGLVSENTIQTAIFDTIDRGKVSKIMKALDKTNSIFGKDTVRLAVQGYKRKWKLRQERLSPNYTTRWGDILTVKV